MGIQNLRVDATGIAFEKNGRSFFCDGDSILFRRFDGNYDWLLHFIKADVTRDDVLQFNLNFLHYVVAFTAESEFDVQCFINSVAEQERLLNEIEFSDEGEIILGRDFDGIL